MLPWVGGGWEDAVSQDPVGAPAKPFTLFLQLRAGGGAHGRSLLLSPDHPRLAGERPRWLVCRGQCGGLRPGHGHGRHGDHLRHAAVGCPPDGQAPECAGCVCRVRVLAVPLACPAPSGRGPPGPGEGGSQGHRCPPSYLQAGCRRSWTVSWGPGGCPGQRTSAHCPTPVPCCTRCRGSSPSCPTCPAARPLTPSCAATCSPRWGHPGPGPHPPSLSAGGRGPGVPDARAPRGGGGGA